MELNFEIIDPAAVVNTTKPLLWHCTTSSKGRLLTEGAGIHRMWEVCRDLANAIAKLAAGVLAGAGKAWATHQDV